MQHVMDLPLTIGSEKNCPPELDPYFFATWTPDFNCWQDFKHILVKAFRALMTKEWVIGAGIASRSVILQLLQQVDKSVLGITSAQLTHCKDRMDYNIAAKVCNPKVTTQLKRLEEQATRGYLEMMNDLEIAYISRTTDPRERIAAAWRACFFARLWKKFLSTEVPNKNPHQDTLPSERAVAEDVHIGDFIYMMFQGSKRIVQVIAFKFFIGKRFYGDIYKFNKQAEREVAALCTLYDCNEKSVSASLRDQRYINMKHFRGHVTLKRDLLTGDLFLI